MVIVPVMVSAVGHADSPASRQVSWFLTLKLTILYSMRMIDGFSTLRHDSVVRNAANPCARTRMTASVESPTRRAIAAVPFPGWRAPAPR